MSGSRSISPGLRALLAFMLLFSAFGGAPAGAAGPAAEQAPHSQAVQPAGFMTANGILVPQGAGLPVFQFLSPQITEDTTNNLALVLEGVYSPTVESEQYLGNTRFVVPNQANNAVLEQYGATGGFYAYNATEAFGETPRGTLDPVEAQYQACLFLQDNQLMPDNVNTPGVQLCDYDFSSNPYRVIVAQGAAVGASGIQGEVPPDDLSLVVQVPMSVTTAFAGAGIQGLPPPPSEIPLGGPGGHISLLFRTTEPDDSEFSLDDQIPGLAAVAMPFHDREFSYLRSVPAVDPNKTMLDVEDAVRDSYPPGSVVTVPVPSLIYLVNDAAVPQRVLEPMLKFSGIEVFDGQNLHILRDIDLPAVQGGEGGLGPDVSITEPPNDSTFVPGATVNFTGVISGGVAPYTYTWMLQDTTLLDTGTLGAPGQVQHAEANLPAVSHGGFPTPVVVILSVEDNEGVVRQAMVSLTPTVAPSAYFPLIQRGDVPPDGQAAAPAQPRLIGPAAVTASNYRFGIHAHNDYPPYGPGGSDLPGVVPDAGGFRNSMEALGYTRAFQWWNSMAWERDWRECGLGGSDCSYGIDRADYVYYAGHGGPGGISLASNVNSTWFRAEDARFNVARWVGFASCQTLRAQWSPASEAPIRRWFNAFQGAHMLLGFNSNMADVAFGPRLVDNMRMPTIFGIPLPWAQRTIREAWVQTAFNMNAGMPAYIYAVGTNAVNPVDNKLPRPNDPALPRPFPVASYHWVWWNE